MKRQNLITAAILSLVVLASGCEFSVNLNSNASLSPSPTIIASPTAEPTPEPTPEPAQTSKSAAAKTQNNSAAVYRTETGSKYHRASCHHLKYSKIKTTIKSAKARGLSPCKVCSPPR
jgi:competence protein ComEC